MSEAKIVVAAPLLSRLITGRMGRAYVLMRLMLYFRVKGRNARNEQMWSAVPQKPDALCIATNGSLVHKNRPPEGQSRLRWTFVPSMVARRIIGC
jgi:hypothetical protein